MSTTETTATTARTPRKKRRVFLWIFLAIQVLFVIWLIVGGSSHGPDTGAQVASSCDNHAWYPLYSSQADCVKQLGSLYAGASDAGKGIGAALVIVFWMIVDVILGVSCGVYKLATRR